MKKLDANDNATDVGNDSKDFIKNQRNKIKVFPRNCNSPTKDGKLLRSESYANKYTTKQNKTCSKKGRNNIRINKKKIPDEEFPLKLFLIRRPNN